MHKIAIFIDEPDARRELVEALEAESCSLLVPRRGDDWLEFVCTQQPSIIMLSPHFEGIELKDFLRTLKKHEALREIKVILVLDDETAGRFERAWQVSDVIFRPFEPVELGVRLKLAMWRDGQPAAEDLLVSGRIAINLANYEVTVNDSPIELTYKEYELLRFLITHPDRVHSRNSLLNYVWGYDYFGGTRTVDVHIRRLREKLGLEASEHIETVRNVGYRYRP